jgi:hypothetical protein
VSDLNVMMREQARNGLQAQLDAAVTNGDTAAATKIAEDIAKLAVSAAPKAPPYNDADIRAQLEKTEWFGVDPKKSAKAVEFGKTMDVKKFANAEAFTAALIKSVEAEFAPVPPKVEEPPENETDEEREAREAEEAEAAEAAKAKKRKTDGPGEGALGTRAARTTGPWTKITDAPADVQKEIKRAADKFVSSSAPKEQREKFVAKALEAHYATHQRKKGKK